MSKSHLNHSNLLTCLVTALIIFNVSVSVQNFRPQSTPNDTLVSPRILADNRVQLSIYAPNAETVLLTASDIPNIGWSKAMTKGANGVWEVTLGPLDPGAYRYQFNVDGVSVINPRSSSVSESNTNVWSLVYVPGSDFMDTKDVPHGAISEVTYYSTSLHRFRRMHVYTPPGYESGKGKYPIFYLLHGAFDCDDSWTTVGRAGFILDNLIAEKKAQPMVVVMPAGHTGPFRWGQPISEARMDEFIQDFLIETSRATVDLLRKYGFEVVYNETSGGHTWINWRHYLNDFAQLLFH